MNTCTFCGRIVADAEMKTTNSGTELCKVRVASDCGWGDNKKTHWLDGVIFGQRGAALMQYLTKGTPVTVVGELEPPRTYDSNSGETRVTQSLVIREIALQGRGGSDDGTKGQRSAQGAGTPSRAHRAPEAHQGETFEPDSEIPF